MIRLTILIPILLLPFHFSGAATAQNAEFDLGSIGMDPGQWSSLQDFQGAFSEVENLQLDSTQRGSANLSIINRLVQEQPEMSTVFDLSTGQANIFLKPNTLFSNDQIEDGISTGNLGVRWDAGPTQFKSIETTPEAALDLIIRAQSSGDSFDAQVIGSNLWTQNGFLTTLSPEALPDGVQQQIEAMDPTLRGDMGIVGLPNAQFFMSFAAIPNLDFPWYGDPNIGAYDQARVLNDIDIELGETTITASDFQIASGPDGLISITGDTDDGLGRLQLSSDASGQFGGVLLHGDQQWVVAPISDQVGGSIYTFVPIGRASTEPGSFVEALPGEEIVPQGNFGADENDRSTEFITLAPREVVTVSFVFSREASDYIESLGVPNLRERFGFNELVRVNGLGGRAEFQSSGTSIANFDGGKNYGQILTEITSGNTESAIQIRQHRDDVSADIVSLVVYRDEPGFEWYCGRVAEIAASSERAYLVWNIHPNCIYRNSLAHEIGHIFGGVHEDHSSEPIRPYAFGFAREAGGQQCSTAMSNACTRCDRSGWSSPISKFFHPRHCHGETMGTRERNDVARLIAEFAPLVSKFRN